MRRFGLNRIAKLLLMMALMAFIATPIVAEAHNIAELSHECESSAASDTDDTSGDEKPSHNKHVHHCGPCHGHMLNTSQHLVEQTLIEDKQVSESILRLPPPLVYGLFRRPRG